MATMSELAKLFNEFCGKIHPVLPEIAEKSLSATDQTLSVPVYTIQLHEPHVWWNDQNTNDYRAQLKLLWDRNPDDYNAKMQAAHDQILKSAIHDEHFNIVRRWVDETGQDDMYLKRLLPHRVGLAGSNYGADLYNQLAYQDMKMSLNALDLDVCVQYTTDSTCPDLSRAFHLCVDISTKDQTPIRPKIMAGRLKGLFAPMSRNIRPS